MDGTDCLALFKEQGRPTSALEAPPAKRKRQDGFVNDLILQRQNPVLSSRKESSILIAAHLFPRSTTNSGLVCLECNPPGQEPCTTFEGLVTGSYDHFEKMPFFNRARIGFEVVT